MQATTYAVVISGDCQVESFGARLKREREQRKITLDEISISTKIATRFLVALEEERFDQLPGGIFNKSFVKAYAHHLSLRKCNRKQVIAQSLHPRRKIQHSMRREPSWSSSKHARIPGFRSVRMESRSCKTPCRRNPKNLFKRVKRS